MSAVIAARATLPVPWKRALLPLALVLIAILVLHWDTARGMEAIWSRSETYAHAYVVPPITAWLIWRLRDRLAPMQPRAEAIWLLPLALAGLLWLAGELVVVNAATQFALVAMLVLAVPAICGTAVARVILFPLVFLFFAVPIGEFLTPQFIEWTADFTVAALRLTGIPVFREGQQFVIPSGNWSVVEACSGVRYLIASFMVGVLFAYLNYRSTWRRVVFSIVSIIVPILANWVRAYMIVMIGHLSGNTLAVGADHLVYGWVLFGLVITALFMIGSRWAEAPAEPGVAAPNAAPGRASTLGSTWIVGVAALLIVAAPHAAVDHILSRDLPGEPQLALPAAPGGSWQARADTGPAWRPALPNPSVKQTQVYVDGEGRTVGVFVAYYRHQDEGRKLVSTRNLLVDAEENFWNAVSTVKRSVELPGRSIGVRESLVLVTDRQGGAAREKLKVWQLYWIDGRLVASDIGAKLIGAAVRMAGRGDDAAAVYLFASDNQRGGAEAALQAFTGTQFGAIEQSLAAVRDSAAPR